MISLDHNLSIRVRHWRNIYFGPMQALIAASALVLFFLLLNSSILFLFSYEMNVNGTNIVICFYLPQFPSTKWMQTWGQAHLFLYSVIPFILLSISNIFLVQKAYETFARKTKVKSDPINTNSNINMNSSSLQTNDELTSHNNLNKKKKDKDKSFAFPIFFMTILFLLMSLPSAYVSFNFNSLFATNNGQIVITVSNCLTFSFHGLNFFIYYATNKKFREQFHHTFSF